MSHSQKDNTITTLLRRFARQVCLRLLPDIDTANEPCTEDKEKIKFVHHLVLSEISTAINEGNHSRLPSPPLEETRARICEAIQSRGARPIDCERALDRILSTDITTNKAQLLHLVLLLISRPTPLFQPHSRAGNAAQQHQLQERQQQERQQQESQQQPHQQQERQQQERLQQQQQLQERQQPQHQQPPQELQQQSAAATQSSVKSEDSSRADPSASRSDQLRPPGQSFKLCPPSPPQPSLPPNGRPPVSDSGRFRTKLSSEASNCSYSQQIHQTPQITPSATASASSTSNIQQSISVTPYVNVDVHNTNHLVDHEDSRYTSNAPTSNTSATGHDFSDPEQHRRLPQTKSMLDHKINLNANQDRNESRFLTTTSSEFLYDGRERDIRLSSSGDVAGLAAIESDRAGGGGLSRYKDGGAYNREGAALGAPLDASFGYSSMGHSSIAAPHETEYDDFRDDGRDIRASREVSREVSRIPSNLQERGERDEGQRREGQRHEGQRHDRQRDEGQRHEGQRHEGQRHEGQRHEGQRHDRQRDDQYRSNELYQQEEFVASHNGERPLRYEDLQLRPAPPFSPASGPKTGSHCGYQHSLYRVPAPDCDSIPGGVRSPGSYSGLGRKSSSSWASPSRPIKTGMADFKDLYSRSSLGDNRRRDALRKSSAATSIYPTSDENLAMIRDVVFCLQGVDGQHIRFDPESERFLIRRDVPLARPLRILAARMVASGNCFMQIHFATCKLASLLPDSGHTPTSRKGDNYIGQWRKPSGVIDSNPCTDVNRNGKENVYQCILPTPVPYDGRSHQPSLVVFAFLQSIRENLSLYYRELGLMEADLSDLEQGNEHILDTMPTPAICCSSRTLRKLIVRLRPVLKRIHCLASMVSTTAGQIGGELLSTLYDMQRSGDPTRSATITDTFEKSVVPLVEYVRIWSVEGNLVDEYNEFFVKLTHPGLTRGYYSCWKDNLLLDWTMIPCFFTGSHARQILAVGKMAYFIRMVKGPSHFEALKVALATRTQQLRDQRDQTSNQSPFEVPSITMRRTTSDTASLSVTTGVFKVEDEAFGTRCEMQTISELPVSQPPCDNEGYSKPSPWPTSSIARLFEDLTFAEKDHRRYIRLILMDEYHLVDHLRALHSFLLLCTGDFADELMDEISQLVIRMGSVSSIVQAEIDMCLEKSLKSSVASRFPKDVTNRLHAIRTTDSERFGNSSWDFFTLNYDLTNNPVSVIVRDDLLRQYRRLFGFLWKLRRITKLQHTIWLTTMHNAFLLSFPDVATILLDVQSLRNEMMHVLQSLEAFFFVDVIQPAFETMMNQVTGDDWADLDELIDIQDAFVQMLLYGTFLDAWPEPNTLGPPAEHTVERKRRRSINGQTLPSCHSQFLSSSCSLPTFSNAQKACEPPRAMKLMDDLLECAASFTDVMDRLQISAYETVEASMTHADLEKDADWASPSRFTNEHAPAVERIREQFTMRLFALLNFLQDMKAKYRSEAIGTLLMRMDLSDFYDRLERAYRTVDTEKTGISTVYEGIEEEGKHSSESRGNDLAAFDF